jgi:hypothetical protein
MVVRRDRERDTDHVGKVALYLAKGAAETALAAFAPVAKAAQRIAECLQRSNSAAGLADYAVRYWTGWHHHQPLSFLATWFGVTETRRGKKWTPAMTLPPSRDGMALSLHHACPCGTMSRVLPEREKR